MVVGEGISPLSTTHEPRAPERRTRHQERLPARRHPGGALPAALAVLGPGWATPEPSPKPPATSGHRVADTKVVPPGIQGTGAGQPKQESTPRDTHGDTTSRDVDA